MKNILENKKLLEKIINDRQVRRELVHSSHEYFLPIYFGDYIKYPTAQFQKEMIALSEDDQEKMSVIVAFRGSAKSTIFSLSYPIWAILGKQQKKFVMIFSQTQVQAKQILKNIKDELERNKLLQQDLGPFEEPDDDWNSSSIVIPKYNARITVASADQSIRGIRHGSHRPDLFILDDVEDLQSAKTRESRAKTMRWFTGEVLPAGDVKTKTVVIGNLVHEDCLVMQLKNQILNGELEGTFKAYPILDPKGKPTWPEKFTSMEMIEQEKKKVMNPQAWEREFMLRIIPDEGQVVHKEWIQYYDELPPKEHQAYRYTYSAVDLAISEKESADCTAVVSARIYGRNKKLRIYVLPNPLNKRMPFPDQIKTLRDHKQLVLTGSNDKLFVESVAYQEALPQMLATHGIKAESVKPKSDKRSRLAMTTSYIQEGRIKFPRKGCEELIQQLIGFGKEKHDDLADAFSMLILQAVEKHLGEATWIMAFVGGGSNDVLMCRDYIDVEVENDTPHTKARDFSGEGNE